MKNSPLLLGAVLLGSFGAAFAGPLTEARINQIVNDVKVIDPQKGARAAALQDTVRDQVAVRTGIQSRAELLFQDATLTRLGAETFFSFKAGTRDLSLERGTMLLQVPKNHGGARIRTASVTASITGTTIMLEHQPGKNLKVLVLEGSLRLSVNNRFGESVTLKPGKMVIMKPDAKSIPNPVDVDIRKVMKTSALVDPVLFSGKADGKVAALPSIPLIEKEIARQDAALERQGLVRTNLVIPGAGSNVVLASDTTLAQLEQNGLRLREVDVIKSALASTETKPQTNLNTANGGSNSGSTVPTLDGSSLSGSFVTNNTGGTNGGLSAGSGTSGSGSGTSGSGSGTSGSGSGTSGSGSGTSGSGSGTSGSGSGTSGSGSGTSGSGSGTSGSPTPQDLVFTNNVDATLFAGTGRLLASGNVASHAIVVGGAIEVGGTLLARGGSATDGNEYFIQGSSIRAGGGLDYSGAGVGDTILGTLINGPQAGGHVTLYADNVTFGSTGINGASLNGADAFIFGFGADGGVLRIGTPTTPIPGEVVFEAPVSATTGRNEGPSRGGSGGTVSADANGQIRVNSRIKVSESGMDRTSNAGGHIALQSALAADDAIRIDSSGQLLSLLDNYATGPGGTIKLVASNGGIKVDGGTVQADRGTVEMTGLGAASNVEIKNANIRGDTVKIGALGQDGQLIIGGGNISADTILKLYAGGSNGTVRFKSNVTLGGASTKIIAGNTVTIDNGKTVTIGGNNPATVHTNNPNYNGSGGNGSTTGQFGGAGANTQSFGTRPNF
jgi:hypothetical protein